MADVSLMAVPSEHDASTCANCGAELVADQRYCLACGHPVSPVRLAFLDVLNEERALPARGLLAPGTIEMAPYAYGPAAQPGLGGWLRRNSGLLSLLAVLLLCLIAGLLVGHWVTQNGKQAPLGTQTVKIEGGLTAAGLGGAASSSTTPSVSSTKTGAANKSSAKEEEAEEAKEAARVEKAAPAKAVEVTSAQAKKLSSSHGKKHQEEINALGNAPIKG
jgi:hypothetical protein